MKRFICLLFFFYLFLLAYGQSAKGSENRINYFVQQADFYFTASNYDKAIELGGQAMSMTKDLYGGNSFEYATSALKMATYFYTKANESRLIPDTTAKQCFARAVKHLETAINITNDNLLSSIDMLNHEDANNLWKQICPLYDNLLPNYVACCPNDSTVSYLYNSLLFSKGITWRSYNKAKEYDWREIQNNLDNDDLAIEFISPVELKQERINYYAIILNKKRRAPYIIKLFDLIQLEKELKSAVSNYDKDLRIGRLIWGSLEKELKGIKNVYFSATHVFHSIPFEFSPINDKTYYCDKYNMYRLSSTAELLHKNKKSPDYQQAALLGGLDYDIFSDLEGVGQTRAGLESLYNTTIEVYDIKALLQKKGIKCYVYTDSNGTKSSFQRLSSLPIDILHLSTHGKYYRSEEIDINEQIELTNSYIAMSGANKNLTDSLIHNKSDGIITALDVSKMTFNNLDLVCISACESGLGAYGDDDSLIGLQKGFKLAGANTIIMSIRKVDDEATRILMVEFYRNLMDGKTKHQSLKEAQRYLRQVDNGRYGNPKYWASFIMLDGLN